MLDAENAVVRLPPLRNQMVKGSVPSSDIGTRLGGITIPIVQS